MLSNLLYYNSETGTLYWKHPPSKHKPHLVGKVVGTISRNGYIYMGYKSKLYMAHRLIWEMNIGKIPKGMQIDHIDGNRTNNRLTNLRIVSHKQNCYNKSKVAGKSSKYKGVCLFKRTNKWLAYIDYDNSRKHLGYYLTESKAAEAYNKAAIEYFGQFAKLNVIDS